MHVVVGAASRMRATTTQRDGADDDGPRHQQQGGHQELPRAPGGRRQRADADAGASAPRSRSRRRSAGRRTTTAASPRPTSATRTTSLTAAPPPPRLTTPTSATAIPARVVAGTRSRRILACSVSTTASASAQRGHPGRHGGEPGHEAPAGCGRKSPAASTSTTQWRAAADQCEERQVAAGVLEQRPLVDHGELEVRVGVVDRLAPGLEQHHQRHREQAAPVRRLAPDGGARTAADHIAPQVRCRPPARPPAARRAPARASPEDREGQVARRRPSGRSRPRRPTPTGRWRPAPAPAAPPARARRRGPTRCPACDGTRPCSTHSASAAATATGAQR